MEKAVVNPFYLIDTKSKKSEQELNKIFGVPTGVTGEKWPKREGQYMHHLITIDAGKLQFPFLVKADIITVFFYLIKKEQKGKVEPFEAVYISRDEMPKSNAAGYPDGYNPWWNDSLPNADLIANGYDYHQKEIKKITELQIREMYEHPGTSELPEPLEKLRGVNSFIGGFPMWIQQPNQPKAKDGSATSYLLMLNGFADYTQATPFEGFDLFLFLDSKGNIYSVAQT